MELFHGKGGTSILGKKAGSKLMRLLTMSDDKIIQDDIDFFPNELIELTYLIDREKVKEEVRQLILSHRYPAERSLTWKDDIIQYFFYDYYNDDNSSEDFYPLRQFWMDTQHPMVRSLFSLEPTTSDIIDHLRSTGITDKNVV